MQFWWVRRFEYRVLKSPTLQMVVEILQVGENLCEVAPANLPEVCKSGRGRQFTIGLPAMASGGKSA